MAMRERNDSGQFEPKGDEPRILRSIRLTDTCWEKLGEVATERSISRADILESMVEDGYLDDYQATDEDDIKLSIIEDIQGILEGLELHGDNELEINSKDKAAGRRVLTALIEYLTP